MAPVNAIQPDIKLLLDYRELRDVETRYRQLFEASNEAVILVRADNLRLVEANPAAIRALGLPLQRPRQVADRNCSATSRLRSGPNSRPC